jgi:hypothetical protein
MLQPLVIAPGESGMISPIREIRFMRCIRLRTVMVVIAGLAVMLAVGVGLSRRARRLNRLALQYSRVANGRENLIEKWKLNRKDADVIIEHAHWLDAVANQYRIAAARPWLLFDPSPQRVTCECGYHANRRARATIP